MIANNPILRFVSRYREAFIWNGALILLGFMNVESATSFCFFKALGFKWCPGCGLGHAIYYALHFEFQKSIHAHILGIPATLILFYQSCKSIYKINKIYNYGSATTIKNVS